VPGSSTRRLLPLSLALFAVGTDGFVIAGLLPAIARDLGVDIPAAGQLVTAFALTFAVSAPVVGAATSALDRRTTMLIGLAGFSVGNAVTALGPTYATVLGARVFTALGAGLIGAAAFSAAAAMAPPEWQGRALATVMGGLSISMAIGLPAGTLIGATDWRVTLWVVTAIGLVAATGGAAATLTVVLLAWGVGNVAGNALGGILSDRYPPKRVVLAGLVAAALVLAVSPLAVGHLGTAVVWAVVWGVVVSMPIVPQQHRLVASAPSATAVLLGLNSSAIYVGVAAGGALGGILQTSFPPALLGLAGAAISGLGAVLTLATVDRARHGFRPTAPVVSSSGTTSPMSVDSGRHCVIGTRPGSIISNPPK
jgi:MFS transporter, DHA1 family, inner membrane transport protein